VEVRFSGTEAGICCSKPMGELLYLMRYWVVSLEPCTSRSTHSRVPVRQVVSSRPFTL